MIILREKWLRDKAKLVLQIVDSPTTNYNIYDYEQAAYDKFEAVLNKTTIKLIVSKIVDLEKQQNSKGE